MKPLISGYRNASQLTGLSARTLKALVAERLIRVRKPSSKLGDTRVFFDEDELEEDLKAMTRRKR